MDRIQPYFRLNKKKMYLEVVPSSPKTTMYFVDCYSLNPEEIPIVEKLMQRDFKTAILYRLSDNEGISTLANDIITQRG